MVGVKRAVLLPLLLALAGCDGGTPASENVSSVAARPNPYQKQLVALSEVDRKLVLRRAVQDDGGTCPKVRSSRYQQEYKGMAMWVSYCSNEAWAVYVDPDGNVQARPCRQSKQLGLPECTPEEADPETQPLWSADTRPLPPPGTH